MCRKKENWGKEGAAAKRQLAKEIAEDQYSDDDETFNNMLVLPKIAGRVLDSEGRILNSGSSTI